MAAAKRRPSGLNANPQMSIGKSCLGSTALPVAVFQTCRAPRSVLVLLKKPDPAANRLASWLKATQDAQPLNSNVCSGLLAVASQRPTELPPDATATRRSSREKA